MKKKLLALALAGTLLCAALTGCGGSTDKPSADGTGTGTEAPGATLSGPEERAQANELNVGIAQDLDGSLDPHKAVAAGTKEVMFNVFEGLMKPTSTGDLIPAVAEDYIISEDRLTYTFTVREGIQFHNGDAVTAEDVISLYSQNKEVQP